MNKNDTYVISIHPGYYINELIDEMEITQEEFAVRLGTTAKTISELVNGKANISKDLAMKLSNMTNTSPDVWLNLQKKYDVQKIEEKRIEEFELQKNLVREIDYAFFVSLGVLPAARNACEKVRNLCSFLALSKLSILTGKDYNVAFRNGIKDPQRKNILCSNIWVETAVTIARGIETAPFNEKKLMKATKDIVQMTTRDIEEVIPYIKSLLADCGVALIMLPYLKNSGLHGVVKWLSKDKVLVAISNRRKYTDTFWFTLFHEIGHVFQKRLKDIAYTWEIPTENEIEKDADSFAQEQLIPSEEYKKFITNQVFNPMSIEAFAKEINRDKGIIVGRLQNDKLINYSQFNKLRSQIPESCFKL